MFYILHCSAEARVEWGPSMGPEPLRLGLTSVSPRLRVKSSLLEPAHGSHGVREARTGAHEAGVQYHCPMPTTMTMAPGTGFPSPSMYPVAELAAIAV